MKYCLIFLLSTLATLFSSAVAQIGDDFSNDELSLAPPWQGDTAHFVINTEGQLQLDAPAVAGKSYITTPSDIINTAQWSFYVKLDFNPSASNYLDIYLTSDSAELTLPLNGYFVRIGSSQDEVSLYKQTGAKSTAEKVIDGVDDRVDFSMVELNVKVTKSPEHQWELIVDPGLTGNLISEGTAVDSSVISSKYFGLVCNYTSSRSTKFYFDDLYISGEAYYDPDPPQIDSLVVGNDSTILIYYNEPLDQSSATDLNNYFVDNGIGNPAVVLLQEKNSVSLIFDKKFEDQSTSQISIHGVKDLFGNPLNNYVSVCTYYAPYMIQFGDLIISEVFPDPSPQVDLPEYEFLEVFNPTDMELEVFDMYLVVGPDSVRVPDFSIDAGDYLILCQSAAIEHYEKLATTLKTPNWPTLNNRGERISLYSASGELVFTVDYDDSWYQSIEKGDGGWSLEMIDKNFPCKGRGNWKASLDPSGGTPGRENTHEAQLTDLTGPEISSIIATSSDQALILLTEKLRPTELVLSRIYIQPPLVIETAILMQPELDQIEVHFAETMVSNTLYNLSIAGMEDCSGNIQSSSTATFVLPEEADSLDIIINELLFNPWTGGVDFVELYNLSDKFIDLQNWSIANKDTSLISSKHFVLSPKQFVALTEDVQVLDNQYPGIDPITVFEVEQLTPFNNDAGQVRLISTGGRSIDYFEYFEDMHSPFISDPEGVSLERISFDGPTSDADNWQSAAESSGFATPGKMNSQYYASALNSDEVIVEPLVFDPGSAGTNSFTLIKCRFDQPGNMATIKVLDASGREVKTIASHQSVGTEEAFKWEGENNNGQEVRMGYYIVYLEVYNAEGARKIYRKKVVVGGRM